MFVCSACGASKATRDRFCSDCGAALTAQGKAQHERKHGSVLLADLCSSTERMAHLDLEAGHALLAHVLRLMQDAVGLYGGTVAGDRGDGLLATFGAPLAQEDHALRACLAAVELQRRTAAERDPALRVQVRIGIASGELLVSPHRVDGLAVHLAARLEQLARPGSVLLAGATARQVHNEVDLQELGLQRLRGLSEPVAVFELLTDGQRSAAAPLARRTWLAPMVGRDAALAQLAEGWAVAESGQFRMVGLRGEAGVGKSRLLAEFVAATPGTCIAVVRSPAYAKQQPLRLMAALLQALLGPTEALTDWPVEHADAASDLLALGGASAAWQALAPPQRRMRISATVLWRLGQQLSSGPMLIVLEDLFLADVESQRLLQALLPQLLTMPLLLCASYRPEFKHAWAPQPWFSEHTVAPLPASAMTALAQNLLGSHASLGQLTPGLLERSDGNPLFLEQLTLTLVDGGCLAGTPGAYHCLRVPDILALPAPIAVIIIARVDRLPGPTKLCLESACILGEPINSDLVALMQGIEPAEAEAHLSQALDAGLLVAARVGERSLYAFRHALVQEAVIAVMTRSRYKLLHRSAFSALRNQPQGRQADSAGVLAHLAYEGEAWDEAAEFAHKAMLRAIAQSSSRDAKRLLELGLAAVGHMAPAEAMLSRELGLLTDSLAALLPLGEMDTIIANLERAQGISRQLGHPRHEAGLWLQLAVIHWTRAHYRAGLAAAAQAEATALTINHASVQLANLQAQMLLNHGLGNYPKVEQLALRAEAEFEPELSFTLLPGWAIIAAVNLKAFRADAQWRMARYAEAQQGCDDGYAVLSRREHAFSRALLDFVQADLWMAVGQHEQARTLLIQALAHCKLHDLRAMLPALVASLGAAMALSGDGAAARAMLDRAIADKLNLTGGRYNDFYFPKHFAVACAAAGDLPAACKSAAEALAIAQALEQQGHAADACALLGQLAAQVGDEAAAATHFRQALALAEPLAMRHVGDAAARGLQALGVHA